MAQLRAQNATLQQEQAPLTNEVARLRAENQRLTNVATHKEDQQALSQTQLNELLKLRGQAGQARSAVQELAKLKASSAPPNGPMQALITNSFAVGASFAEKSQKRQALAKVARMKEILHLTDEQAQAITDLMNQHIEERTRRAMQMMSGTRAPADSQAASRGTTSEEAEIKALLRPDQLAAYPDYQRAEASAAADDSARAEMARMTWKMDFSPEQQDKIRAALYQYNLAQPASTPTKAAFAEAKANGNYAEAIRLEVDSQRQALEDKLKVLDGLLTPDQLQTYKQEQLDMIDTMVNASKMFLPQPTNPAAQ